MAELREYTFVCQDCGESETRIKKFTKNGKLDGGKPRFCLPCKHHHNVQAGRKYKREAYYGVKKSPWTPEAKELALKLRAGGHSSNEIARALGITRNAVIGFLHRSGNYRRRCRAKNPFGPRAAITPADRQMSNAELAAYRAAQPLDTRDIGAILMGDPPHHRSALASRVNG